MVKLNACHGMPNMRHLWLVCKVYYFFLCRCVNLGTWGCTYIRFVLTLDRMCGGTMCSLCVEHSLCSSPCRYSEFHSLHQKLRSSFPRQRLPALPRKILFGRSQVRAVAQQRMTELQRYLKVCTNKYCMRVCVCVCVRVCMRACVRVHVLTYAGTQLYIHECGLYAVFSRIRSSPTWLSLPCG